MARFADDLKLIIILLVIPLLLAVISCVSAMGQDAKVWKPKFSVQHDDNRSRPLQPMPKEMWVVQRRGGESRWNLRGDMYPPETFQSKDHAKHVVIGKTVTGRITIFDLPLLELPRHADWVLFWQYHGKRDPTDTGVGQINVSLRRDAAPNGIRDGLSWFLGQHGDIKETTTNGVWASKRYAWIPFSREQLPVTWWIRVKGGGDGRTPAADGRVYEEGETVFYYQTAQMAEPVEVWYVRGPNYFPFKGKPTAGIQTPTFGMYVGNSLAGQRQRVVLTDIAVSYEDTFTREPVFNFNDKPGQPSDPIGQGLGQETMVVPTKRHADSHGGGNRSD